MAVKRDETLDCGHSMSEVGDYLEHGMNPPDQHVDHCETCQAALEMLRELRTLSESLQEFESQPQTEEDSHWVSSLFGNLALEIQAGRSIPLTADSRTDSKSQSEPESELILTQTEGSVVNLVRDCADSVDGLLIGRCSLEGDLETPGAPVVVTVRAASVIRSRDLRNLANHTMVDRIGELRKAVRNGLEQHTQLNLQGVDVIITDVHFKNDSGSNGSN